MKLKFVKAFARGVRDGFDQVELRVGVTWDARADRDYAQLNERYDQGANVGEALARFIGKRLA